MIGTMRLFGGVICAAALALAAAACSDPVAPNAPVPVTPTITETFAGTLTIGGTDLFTFTVNQVGGLQVTLASIQPSAAVQLSVGTPSTSTGVCEALSGLTAVAGPNAQLSGTATVPGSFCVSVTDIGNLVEAVNFTILVLHS
jgi:hypothetical protein